MNRLDELRARFGEEPFAQALQAKLEDLDEGLAVVSLLVTKELVIVERIVNGGFLATLGNSAGVYAAMSKIPAGHTRALHLDINFEHPAKEGEIIKGVAHVKNESGNFILVLFEVLNSEQKLLAYGTARYVKPKKCAI